MFALKPLTFGMTRYRLISTFPSPLTPDSDQTKPIIDGQQMNLSSIPKDYSRWFKSFRLVNITNNLPPKTVHEFETTTDGDANFRGLIVPKLPPSAKLIEYSDPD